MISVSTLSGYLYCPRKLYLQYVLKLEEPPKESLVKGTIRHSCYDGINKADEEIVKSIRKGSIFDGILTIYKREHLKILHEAIEKNKERIESVHLSPEGIFSEVQGCIMFESTQRALNIASFIKKHNVYGAELWEILTPKIISELSIQSDSLGVRGIIDQIEVYPEKKVPVELKTGSAPREGVWPGHKIQVAAYGLLMEGEFKCTVEEGYITYLDINERRKVPFNVFIKDEIKALIEKVNALLSASKPPQILLNSAKCKSCGLKDQCYSLP